jgi:hypothetical protein
MGFVRGAPPRPVEIRYDPRRRQQIRAVDEKSEAVTGQRTAQQVRARTNKIKDTPSV